MRKILQAALLCALSTCAAAPAMAEADVIPKPIETPPEMFPNPANGVSVFCLTPEATERWALAWESANYIAGNEVLMRRECFVWTDLYGKHTPVTWKAVKFINANLMIVSFKLPDQRTGYSYLFTRNGV